MCPRGGIRRGGQGAFPSVEVVAARWRRLPCSWLLGGFPGQTCPGGAGRWWCDGPAGLLCCSRRSLSGAGARCLLSAPAGRCRWAAPARCVCAGLSRIKGARGPLSALTAPRGLGRGGAAGCASAGLGAARVAAPLPLPGLAGGMVPRFAHRPSPHAPGVLGQSELEPHAARRQRWGGGRAAAGLGSPSRVSAPRWPFRALPRRSRTARRAPLRAEVREPARGRQRQRLPALSCASAFGPPRRRKGPAPGKSPAGCGASGAARALSRAHNRCLG